MLIRNTWHMLTSGAQGELAAWLILSILLFLVLGLVFFLLQMTSRFRKLAQEREDLSSREELEEILIRYLFDETSLEQILQDKKVRIALQRRRSKQRLLDSVLRLHGNFTGEYASRIEAFYTATPLENLSLQKLRSMHWFVKCRGIRELTQMRSPKALERITPYTRSRKKVLRTEAQLAVLTIQGFEGLHVLENISGHISEWDQLNFIAVLRQAPAAEVPEIGRWLRSGPESLRVMALRIIIEFGMTNYPEAVREAFPAAGEQARLLSLRVLGMMHDAEMLAGVLPLFPSFTPEQQALLIQLIGEAGDTSHIPFLLGQLDGGNRSNRFAALKALSLLAGNDFMQRYTVPRDEELMKMAEHVAHPMLHG